VDDRRIGLVHWNHSLEEHSKVAGHLVLAQGSVAATASLETVK
jgi:ABC-type molybdate transport system ATPase subunit